MTETPRREPVAVGPARAALSVDVEEWYHTCLVPDYVHPERRPSLPRELDWLLPEVLELLESVGARGTFFVLGEVADQVPERIREVLAAGHEIASHGYHHLRVGELDLEAFRRDVSRSKKRLEDLVGVEVSGYRSPEWSLRRFDNPRLRVLVEEGYAYDSSLAPFLFAGSLGNRRDPHRLCWSEPEASLLELPPFTYGGPARLPAAGWPARGLPPGWIAGRVRAALEAGRSPVVVVHPWELSRRETPGRLSGLAGFVHEAGRSGYRRRFEAILRRETWVPLRELVAS